VRLCFLLVRRVPPVPSPVLREVERRLRAQGFVVDELIAEEVIQRPELPRGQDDLFVLKSHTELTLSLAGVLDAVGARMLNPYPHCQMTQDKIQVAARLRAAGVPIPRSWVTGRLELLAPLLEEHQLVIKPHRGHRGAGIVIVRDPSDLITLPPPTNPVIVQELIKGPGEDLKVYVVGRAVFAVRKPFSPTSFTRPGRPVEIDEDVRTLAWRVGDVLGLGLYGLDVVESDRGPVVVDVNYFPGYKGVPEVAPLLADYIAAYARGEETLRTATVRAEAAR
jgi:ribosomal protein S6--L-glutamate ligase